MVIPRCPPLGPIGSFLLLLSGPGPPTAGFQELLIGVSSTGSTLSFLRWLHRPRRQALPSGGDPLMLSLRGPGRLLHCPGCSSTIVRSWSSGDSSPNLLLESHPLVRLSLCIGVYRPRRQALIFWQQSPGTSMWLILSTTTPHSCL